MPLEGWIQHSRADQFLYDWQTLIAGVLAVGAAAVTIWATIWSASREVAASQAQTAVAWKQIETTFNLEQMRNASETLAFHGMLAAAMARVLAEAAWARKTYPDVLTRKEGRSVDAFVVRQFIITKGAFAELRAACVRRGGDLTVDFLDLEREIDSFASQCGGRPTIDGNTTITLGENAGLDEQLASIERKADALREKAVERFSGSIPDPPRRSGGPVTGLP
jgi:hypothetical protein